jgi:DNA-binding NarL/FixJ family response regulator
MNLIARRGYAKDLADCYALHESLGLPYAQGSWRILPEMWLTYLSDGRMQLFLVEDRARPLGSRIVSFNAIVFVSDKFCSEARSTLPPYLGVQMARHYFSHELPILNRQQIARANAHNGLNVLMCFGGCEHDRLSRAQFLALREKQNEAFHLALSGYHVKEFLAEPIGKETLQWMLDAGVNLRRNYSNYFRKHGSPAAKPAQRPWLVGLTTEEALAHPGSYFASFFVYTPLRFHFNRSEQELLHHALMGETCAELAASLFISPWTVKKRWHAIYERVADIDSELLPPPIANAPHASSRGGERRRRLLHYLRQHLEELRPSELPKRFSASAVEFRKSVKSTVISTRFGSRRPGFSSAEAFS